MYQRPNRTAAVENVIGQLMLLNYLVDISRNPKPGISLVRTVWLGSVDRILSSSNQTIVIDIGNGQFILLNYLYGISRKPNSGRTPAKAVFICPFLCAKLQFTTHTLTPAVGRVTVYKNLNDGAISASKSLFSSHVRLGALNFEELTQQQRKVIERSGNLDIIMYEGSGGGIFRHSYYRNPAISSDLLMLLHYGWLPGQEGRHALKPTGPNLWTVTDAYLK